MFRLFWNGLRSFDNPYKKNLQNRTSPPPFSPHLQSLACMSAPSWCATEAPLRARKTTFAPQPQPHCHATEPPLCGNGASVAMRREKVFRWDSRKVLFYKRLRTTLITQKFRAKIFFLTAKRFSRLFRHCFFDTKDRQIVNFKINSKSTKNRIVFAIRKFKFLKLADSFFSTQRTRRRRSPTPSPSLNYLVKC